MKIRISELRKIIRSVLSEQAWMPGRYYPAAEPLDGVDRDRLDQELGEEDDILDEVDTDPSNNPGRPGDTFEYLGMHPKPEAALAHPGASGGGGGGASASSAGPSDESW